tara:strand:- start:123 stop:1184 length:1062 start_codon:yes stop_codon:yes gene_type:complete
MRLVLVIGALCLGLSTSGFAQDELSGNKKGAYLQRLMDALRDDDSYKVRLQAAILIGRQDVDKYSTASRKMTVQTLISSSKSDPHYTVRAASLLAIASMGPEWGVSHIIKRYAFDSDDYVRQQALRALNKYDRVNALPYVVALYGEPDVRIRREVVRYLANGMEVGVENVLARALGDVEEVSSVAQEVIRAMPSEKSIQFLRRILDNKDPGVRRNAIHLLGFLDSNEAAGLVLGVYERDIEADEVRQATRFALRNLKAFLPIEEILQEADSEDKHIRAKSLRLLGVIGELKAIERLRVALSDNDVYIRGTAVMALGELGDTSVIDALKRLETDPANQRILHLIKHTLKKISEN